MKTVAIHQPNFFPWLGYFNKILQSDVFIFLDDVQTVKTGGSWFNRVKFPSLDHSETMWATVPIQRVPGTQEIRNTIIADRDSWRTKFLSALTNKYPQAKFRSQTLELISSCLKAETTYLSELNTKCIQSVCREIGISNCEFVQSSKYASSATGTDRLVELTKKAGAETYLCGGGSAEYFDEKLFTQANLKVRYQKFTPKAYPQGGGSVFLPGLSILDLLMNMGTARAKEFIE